MRYYREYTEDGKKTLSEYLVYTGPQTKYDKDQSLDKEEITIDWKYVIDSKPETGGATGGKLPTSIFGLFSTIKATSQTQNNAYQNAYDPAKGGADKSKAEKETALNVTTTATGDSNAINIPSNVLTTVVAKATENVKGVILETGDNSTNVVNGYGSSAKVITEQELYTSDEFYSNKVPDVYLNDNVITSKMIQNSSGIYLKSSVTLPNGQVARNIPSSAAAVIEKNITARQDFSSDIRY